MAKINSIELSCDRCRDTGFIRNPNDSSPLKIKICSCKLQNIICQCEQKEPFLWYNPQDNALIQCPCSSVRRKFNKSHFIYKQANIPIKYQYELLNSFQTDVQDQNISKNLNIEKDFANFYIRTFPYKQPSSTRGLFYHGYPGVGKTKLLCILLTELVFTYQIQALYIKITRDFFAKIRNTFSTHSERYGTAEEVFKKIANTELLFIDDLGVQSDSQWEQSIFYDLIDYRYEYKKVTFFSSNHEPKDFRSQFNGRIYSRLYEMIDIRNVVSFDFRENFIS